MLGAEFRFFVRRRIISERSEFDVAASGEHHDAVFSVYRVGIELGNILVSAVVADYLTASFGLILSLDVEYLFPDYSELFPLGLKHLFVFGDERL